MLSLGFIVLYSSCVISSYGEEYSFAPFPYLSIFADYLEDGDWYRGDFLLKELNIENPDTIQQAAVEEGIFSPHKYNLTSKAWHLFTTNEAVSCLENKRLAFAGDSYMKHMLIGLIDILQGDPSNEEIFGREHRIEVTEESIASLAVSPNSKVRTITIEWLFPDCEHRATACFTKSIKAADLSYDVFLINNHLHPTINKQDMHSYLDEVRELFDLNLRFIWVTGPWIDSISTLSNDEMIASQVANKATFTEAMKRGIPTMDMITLTKTCPWRNCCADGTHRSRFVNRMKAQMLLNDLCQKRKSDRTV